jgi:hypothetical protein
MSVYSRRFAPITLRSTTSAGVSIDSIGAYRSGFTSVGVRNVMRVPSGEKQKATGLYSRTQVRGDIRRFDGIKRNESSILEYIEFLKEVVSETLVELIPALLRGVQLR